MEYKIEKQKGNVKLSFNVPNAEWQTEIELTYVRTRGKYNVHGFRKGTAPRGLIEKAYGPTVFVNDALDSCFSKAYTKALQENDIEPVDEPKVEVQKYGLNGENLEFTIEVTVKPEVTLGNYKGLTVKKAVYEVTAKDVDAQIDRVLGAHARLVNVTDRAAKEGDTVNIDYSGSINGVKFSGGTAKKQDLELGSHSFIPGFEEQVVGMKIGESKNVNVKFPDDYHSEEVKGKDAVFAVTLHEIKKREVPELNDKFVQDTTEFDTVEAYRANIEKNLKDNAERREKNENRNNMLDAVVNACSVEIPDCMVETELDYMMQDFEYRLAQMYGGMKLDDYFKYTGTSREEMRGSRREEAYKAVKTRLIAQAIIIADNIEPTQEEIDAFIAETAQRMGKSEKDFKATLDEHAMSHIKNDATVEKLFTELEKVTNFEVVAEEKKAAPKTSTKKAPADKKD